MILWVTKTIANILKYTADVYSLKIYDYISMKSLSQMIAKKKFIPVLHRKTPFPFLELVFLGGDKDF